MKFLRSHAFAVITFCSCLLFVALPHRSPAAEMDQAILQADRAFVQAAAAGDTAKLNGLLDENFTWCDSNGQTQSAAEVLRAIPKDSLGDESGVDVTERTYGQIAAVSASRGKVHLLRLWVQRPGGWRLLVYHEVTQLDQPSTSAGSGVNDCENPCKSVPFRPANDAEQAIIASWQALETAVTAHESAGWAPHIADEFVQISSNSDHPISKSGRMATLDKQKQLGVGSAPSPLVSAKMFDFGDSVVMTCLHQPFTGKPVHVSRLWIKRDGQWVMVISYQTTIQAGAAKAD
ncbi:MAG TPA: nuclear transport factor 2 family protein [Candidatus Acidoferrum sp.]